MSIHSLILAALLAVPTVALGQTQTVAVDADQSTLSYTGRHRLHDWTGTSRQVTGTLALDLQDPADSQVTIMVPVESFDSGNSNRDSNMLDVVEVDRYPEVTFTSTSVTPSNWAAEGKGYAGQWLVRGDLAFHGQTHAVEIPVAVRVADGVFTGEGTFEISLEQHGVERPKLLLMPIRDTLSLAFVIKAPIQERTGS